VSVILPVRNERRFIARSLEAVLSQDYPGSRLEILVADGMSTDGTREEVRRVAANFPRISVGLIDNPGRIVPTGMNAAMRHARGEIIVRVDGHCEVANDYVRRCVEHLLAGRADGVGGPITTIGQTPVARAISLAMSSPFGVGDSAFRTRREATMLTDTIAFPAYTRSIVEKAGPYDEELVRNQDDEYNYRLRKLGARLLLAADVRSRYFSRASLRALARQYCQYGYWKVRVMQKHPRQMRVRQFAPACFVIVLFVLAAAAAIHPLGQFALLGFALLYGLACLVATICVVRRSNWHYAILLPICFAILHVSYGLGFLVGLLRFWRRWGDAGTEGRSANSGESNGPLR
jgi:glycosyltransferase involved in cell wall biosynthesis